MRQIIALFITICLLAFACKKEAGEGGTSTITGKVFAKNYDKNLTFQIDSFYIADYDVYIMYGDNSIYNDKFKTNYDGSFEFKHLRKGKYTVYALSKDLINRKEVPMICVKETVEITKNKQTITTNDLIIID